MKRFFTKITIMLLFVGAMPTVSTCMDKSESTFSIQSGLKRYLRIAGVITGGMLALGLYDRVVSDVRYAHSQPRLADDIAYREVLKDAFGQPADNGTFCYEGRSVHVFIMRDDYQTTSGGIHRAMIDRVPCTFKRQNTIFIGLPLVTTGNDAHRMAVNAVNLQLAIARLKHREKRKHAPAAVKRVLLGMFDYINTAATATTLCFSASNFDAAAMLSSTLIPMHSGAYDFLTTRIDSHDRDTSNRIWRSVESDVYTRKVPISDLEKYLNHLEYNDNDVPRIMVARERLNFLKRNERKYLIATKGYVSAIRGSKDAPAGGGQFPPEISSLIMNHLAPEERWQTRPLPWKQAYYKVCPQKIVEDKHSILSWMWQQ